jgi:hypothetical protein
MAFKVFISHSVADLGVVYQLKQWLELNGIETYLAELYPQPGVVLGDKVASAINQSDCVIGLITSAGGRSQWVNQEIGYAKAKGRLIIPVVERGESLPGFVEGREYVPFDRANPADSINRLIEYLSHLRASKEDRDKALAGLVIFFGLLALAAASSKK